jgi:metal-sulfur cluster biosynthetic enzyme
MSEQRAMTPLETEEDVTAFAHAKADEVHDPCSMAIGLKIGLSEMGLVRHVTVAPAQGGWDLKLQLRLTSPGCQYFYYFRESLEERLNAHPDIVTAEVLWDQIFDWTPEDFAPSAQAKIDARQQLLQIQPR